MIASDLQYDKTLFKQIAAGDEQAFRIFFDLYTVDLFRVVLRLTKSQVIAEEIIQEVFIGLWISRRHLPQVKEPSSYIYRSLFNKTTNYLKKEANQESIIRAAMQYRPSACENTQEAVEANETRRIIEVAMLQLPAQQKRVYKLSRQEGLSNDKIASELNVSQHTVKSHLSKAIGFIRSHLKDIAVEVTFWAAFSNYFFS